MKGNEPFLYHALISPALNAGLLTAEEVCRAAERAHREGCGAAALRGGLHPPDPRWREYVRGLYWARMPAYAETNALAASRPLPWFYWSGETDLHCIRQVVDQTRAHAYAHHIQRLMVTGNFALIAGLDPAQVEEWYLVVFADAYEWVELPNVHGMVLWAMAASRARSLCRLPAPYIDRMSDYCRDCAYDVKARPARRPCPFNYLYWKLPHRDEERLAGNQRMAMPYRTLAGMDDGPQADPHGCRPLLDSLSADQNEAQVVSVK